MIKYAYEKALCGNKIFTNLGLKFPKNCDVEKLDSTFFKNYAESKFNLLDSVILVDEAHVFYDSRNAMLKRNKIFAKFITQSRKRSVNLCYTTQDKSPLLFLSSGQVDLRLRKLTDYIIYCEKIKHKGHIFIKQSFCDQYGIKLSEEVFDAKPYFNLYDTNEIIDFEND